MKREMMNSFYNEQRIKELYFSDGSIGVNGTYIKGTVVLIKVVMENGQVDKMPWAYVEYDSGDVEKYNLAMIEGVLL